MQHEAELKPLLSGRHGDSIHYLFDVRQISSEYLYKHYTLIVNKYESSWVTDL